MLPKSIIALLDNAAVKAPLAAPPLSEADKKVNAVRREALAAVEKADAALRRSLGGLPR